jgi:hypothetical protein
MRQLIDLYCFFRLGECHKKPTFVASARLERRKRERPLNP